MKILVKIACILSFIITAGFQVVYSQTVNKATIKGNIFTIDGKPAAYVAIELKKLGKILEAERNGSFIIQNLPALNDTLIISGVGFISYKKFIQLSATQTLDIGSITLEYNVAQLQDVEITGRIVRSYKSDYSFAGTKIQTALKDIPQSVSTVTKELIKDKMDLHLADALDDVAGVTRYSGYDEYTIRGFRAENPHLINGLRTYNTSLTNPMLVNVERIEVIKGPTSVLYGNADPGGTINLVTKKPLAVKDFQIDLYKGSWNTIRAQTDINGALNKTKKILYRFNAGYDNEKSFRNQFYAKAFQAAPSLSFIPNEKIQLNLDVSVSHTNTVIDRGQPGFRDGNNLKSTPVSLMVTQPGDYLKETNVASIVSFSYKLNNHITFNSAFLNYRTRQSLSEHGIKDYITNDSVDLYYTNRQVNTVTNSLTNYFTFQFSTGKFNHQLLAGYDFVKSSVDFTQWNGESEDVFGEGSGIAGTFSLKNPQYFSRPVYEYEHEEGEEDADDFEAEEYHTHGLYIQEQMSYNKWKLLASLRQEFYIATGDDNIKQNVLLPRIGIVYAPISNVHIYATYNKGFDPFEAALGVQVFNEPFKPIYSEMLETGVKTDLFKNKLSATLAIYQVTLNNVAVNANDPANPDLYVQRGQEQARGIETEASGNILPNLGVSVSYAYNVAKISKSDKPEEVGNIKENAPRNSSSSRLKYSFTKGFLKGFGISAGHMQAGKRNTLVTNFILPGYCILNAGVQYSHNNTSIAFNLNNIANKTYWSAAYHNINKWPGTPRNYIIRVGYHF